MPSCPCTAAGIERASITVFLSWDGGGATLSSGYGQVGRYGKVVGTEGNHDGAASAEHLAVVARCRVACEQQGLDAVAGRMHRRVAGDLVRCQPPGVHLDPGAEIAFQLAAAGEVVLRRQR